MSLIKILKKYLHFFAMQRMCSLMMMVPLDVDIFKYENLI